MMFAETLIPPVTVQHEHSSSLTYLFVGLHEITLSARSLEEQNNMYLDIYALILMAISHSPTPTPIPIPIGFVGVSRGYTDHYQGRGHSIRPTAALINIHEHLI